MFRGLLLYVVVIFHSSSYPTPYSPHLTIILHHSPIATPISLISRQLTENVLFKDPFIAKGPCPKCEVQVSLISLSLGFKSLVKGCVCLFVYTGGDLFNVECCIGQL